MIESRSAVVHYNPSLSGRRFETGPWSILCDFDGTISVCDVTDRLLGLFGQDGCEALEDDWKAGRIGSRTCMAGQIALLDMSREELDAELDRIDIDPAFPAFCVEASRRGVALKIVSDGLDYAIHRILKRYGLDHLPVAANRLVQTAERGWKLEFPYARKDCRPASGNCKCALVGLRHQAGQHVLFVGDGSSDFCASGIADLVLAKDRLQDYCREHALPHHAIRNFRDASALLPGILAVPAVTALHYAGSTAAPKRVPA